MRADRRNPYVILGVHYGASAEEAAAGFARSARRLRGDTAGPWGLEDATWALHQLEQAAEDPEHAVGWYRVPADPQAYCLGDGQGILNPPPINLERQSGDSAPAVRELQAEVLVANLRPEIGAAATVVPDVRSAEAAKLSESRWGQWAMLVLLAGTLAALIAVVAFMLLEDEVEPLSDVGGVTTAAPLETTAPLPGWDLGGCVALVDLVASPATCGPDSFRVEQIMAYPTETLSADDLTELRAVLAFLGIDPGPTEGDVSLAGLVEGAEVLALAPGADPRDLLVAGRVALDAAHAEDERSYTVRSEPARCGFLPYVLRPDGIYCLAPPTG